MAVAFVSSITADPTANLPQVSLLPSSVTLDGLVHYWDVVSAALSPSSRVLSINPWRGTQKVIQYSDATAPVLETIGGRQFAKFEKSRNTKLMIGETPPTPIPITGDYSAGITVSVVMRITNNASVTNLFMGIAGFMFRTNTNGTNLQIQKYYNGGANIHVGNMTITPISSLSVFTFTYNVSTNTLKIYINGVYINQIISANWGSPSNSSSCFGSDFVSTVDGNTLEGNMGIIAVHNRTLTAEEVLFTANGLKAIAGI